MDKKACVEVKDDIMRYWLTEKELRSEWENSELCWSSGWLLDRCQFIISARLMHARIKAWKKMLSRGGKVWLVAAVRKRSPPKVVGVRYSAVDQFMTWIEDKLWYDSVYGVLPIKALKERLIMMKVNDGEVLKAKFIGRIDYWWLGKTLKEYIFVITVRKGVVPMYVAYSDMRFVRRAGFTVDDWIIVNPVYAWVENEVDYLKQIIKDVSGKLANGLPIRNIYLFPNEKERLVMIYSHLE